MKLKLDIMNLLVIEVGVGREFFQDPDGGAHEKDTTHEQEPHIWLERNPCKFDCIHLWLFFPQKD